ncbi:helix-turn-helix transcriptional regulator [Raoultibacter phocaeensis]|uniref:helix-turn-helix transcriptional regulator n=1 Tax=Raoultibacter phocaeensis TaxID=2479841 RepID=UPI00111BC576|nr:helix-turn-helix domain-containing protein [Raoultibacter phocaeensis]
MEAKKPKDAAAKTASSPHNATMSPVLQAPVRTTSRTAADPIGAEPEKEGEPPAWARYTNIPFRLLGYGILMGWHFLLIYFSTAAAATEPDAHVLLLRQLTLNAALAVTFIGLSLTGRAPQVLKPLLSLPAISGVAATGTAATAGIIYAQLFGANIATVACMAVAGASEGLLLFAWLHFYSETETNYATQYIATSIVIGALAAFFIRHLTVEIAWGCFVTLPAISAAMLAISIRQTPVRSADRGGRGLTDHKGAVRPLVACAANLAVFSAAFGFLQGSILPDGNTVLAAFTPNAAIGAAAAGAMAMVVYRKIAGRRAPELLRRVSIVVFAAGVMGAVYPWAPAKEIAGMAIMAGFMIVDITSLVHVVKVIRSYDIASAFAIGLNRAVEYSAFGVSIAAGALLARTAGADPLYPLYVGGAVTILTLAYVMACMGGGPLDWIASLFPEKALAEEGEETLSSSPHGAAASNAPCDARPGQLTLGYFRLKCRAVCEQSNLSPRESEVLVLMAKGRNAEYIQNALTISNYTARTHIANVYRKCDVHSLQELIDKVEQTDVENA